MYAMENRLKVVVLYCIILLWTFTSTCKKLETLSFVSTGEVTNFLQTTADAPGKIVDIGEGSIQYGHCYAKTPDVDINDSKTELGVPKVTGDYISHLTNLDAGTKYYVKAYIRDGDVTVYGKEVSFTTLQAPANPEYTGAVVENASPTILELTYSLSLANVVPAVSAFNVMVNSAASTVNSVSVSGTKVQLTIASPIVFGDVVTVAYTKPATNPLQTAAGGQAATISAQSVTNNVSAAVPVYLSSVVENTTPSVLELTYNMTLANVVPAVSAFNVMVNSAARTVNSVSISGTKVQLTLASPIVTGDVVTVAYTKPATNQLQTPAGGQAATISAQSVTNNVSAAVPVYLSSVVENTTPSVLELTYNMTLANVVPATSAFTILVNGGGNPVNSVNITGTKVQLTLANPVAYKDIITVSYTKPASNPIQTPAGGQAASISGQMATNNVFGIPSVVTLAVSSITTVTANSGGEIFDNGGSTIINKGVCWSTSSNPTIADYHSEDGSGSGAFTSLLLGLNNSTTYYLRAYATNSKGTGYGSELTFKTFTGTIKDIENNSYYTIAIGTQLWMAQNLKTTRFNDGSSITYGLSSSTDPSYCWYNNDENANKNTYGALYNFASVTSDKLCPSGWHIPSYEEWTVLTTFLGGDAMAGGKLKETGTAHWVNPNIGATNESGFTSFSGGYRSENGFFDYIGTLGFFSSITVNSGSPWYAGLANNSSAMVSGLVQKAAGLSVRCLQGEGPGLPTYVSSVVADATPAVLELTYNMTLANVVPATSAFTVLVNGGGNPVNSVAITGTKVQLTLANPVAYNDAVSVSYIKPASNQIQSISGGQAASITNQPVINNTIGIPVIITGTATSVTITTANSGGEIIDNGGASVTSRGVCWSTAPNPTVADLHSDDGPGTGIFTSYIAGLAANTIYYIRAYAINSKGTGYGNELRFKTFTGIVKDVENNSYYTVTIGTQVWMAQNLKTTRYNDGISIPNVTDGTVWASLGTPAYCWYNNDEAGNKNIYGALYNWNVIQTGILCPTGWHVPSDTEWTTLATYLGGESVSGGKLKEAGFMHWQNPNTGATNETGFTGLPGGYRSGGGSGSFDNIRMLGFLASSTYAAPVVWYRLLYYNSLNIGRTTTSKTTGFSVRCLKD
jgi:uncharacterized protein (TIGR02145 family)/uncharacterized repeat protein (TIGR02059 family)